MWINTYNSADRVFGFRLALPESQTHIPTLPPPCAPANPNPIQAVFSASKIGEGVPCNVTLPDAHVLNFLNGTHCGA